MNWKSWFYLLLIIPITAFVFWFFMHSPASEAGTAQHAPSSVEPVPAPEKPLVSFVDPQRGAENPRVTVVEYGDHACPYCKQSEEAINRVLQERDDVRFVWKDLPSPLHTGADIAAEAAQCAKDQGKFWEFHQALFEQGGYFNATSLSLTANDLGLDLDRFGQCLSGRDKRYLVERSVSEATALGIDGTPYFFIGTRRYSGQMNYDQFIEALDH